MAYKRPESVLIVVRSATDQVLLLRRAGADGFWQSVTGSLEAGEETAACAARELREETGLEAPVHDCHLMARFAIRASALHRYPPGTVYNDEHLFECVLPTPVDITLSDEHTAYEWVSVDAALARVWSETNRDGIRQTCAAGAGTSAPPATD
ncbi:MAG: dihydroneopterin triphosphate diphosphatase [Pseudomonadota bacterium]